MQKLSFDKIMIEPDEKSLFKLYKDWGNMNIVSKKTIFLLHR